MRDLNMMEIDAVSGAGFWEAVSSAVLMGTAGLCGGAVVGGQHGGDGGGILGVGIIGSLVGVIYGSVLGVAAGAVIGAVIGWNDPDTVTAMATQIVNNIANGTMMA